MSPTASTSTKVATTTGACGAARRAHACASHCQHDEPLLLVWDSEVHRYGRGFSTEDLVNGALNKTQEALDVLFDVHMLASCVGATA